MNVIPGGDSFKSAKFGQSNWGYEIVDHVAGVLSESLFKWHKSAGDTHQAKMLHKKMR